LYHIHTQFLSIDRRALTTILFALFDGFPFGCIVCKTKPKDSDFSMFSGQRLIALVTDQADLAEIAPEHLSAPR
jgi:hypothetical protein